MDQIWTWLLGLGVLSYIVSRWMNDRKQREETSKFFNEVVNKQINEREEAIKESTRKQSETLEAYYARINDYNSKYRPGHDDGKS